MASRSVRVGRSRTGLGLFAAKPIKRNTYIATYRGQRITPDEAERREARGAKYLFDISKRLTIDGSTRANLARYINHGCRPNAKPITRKGQIVFTALRAIAPGEEITFHYGPDYYKCLVNEGGCRCSHCHAKEKRRRKMRGRS